MKKQLNWPLLALLLFVAAGCENTVILTSGNLRLTVDEKMRIKVASDEACTQAFYEGFIESDALFAEEFTASRFELTRTEKNTENGKTTWSLAGVYQADGFRIEKHQHITVPNDRGGTALFETFYVNTGHKEAAVLGWKMHELRVEADSSLWSFQPSSSSKRADWLQEVKPGYYKKNYLGMNDTDYGGGIPLVDLWRKDGGVAAGITETTLKTISMPVRWSKNDTYASASLRYDYEERYRFAPGDTLRIYDSFIGVHTGDFFDPLNRFARIMESKGMAFPASEPEAYEPVWCAWGYERTFTAGEVLSTLPKVKEMGFEWVDIDDGYQVAEGDWETNARFPGGDRDMRRLTDAVHALGMKAKLWWAPLAADPEAGLLKEHPEMLLRTKGGAPQYITWWNSFYLSPVNPVTREHTDKLLERFLITWNFDGLKLDGQHLNLCAPDYNRASRLDNPQQAVEQMPAYFEHIYSTAKAYKPYSVVQFCPCGCAVNFFMVPFMNQAVASDPTSSWQIRHKGKAYRAINDRLAYYADHVELSDGGDDFGTQIGIGGVIGSKFTYPKDNPDVKKSYLLTPEKEKLYKKWVGIYREKMISRGEYLNLYDIAYDKPEAHVIRKDGRLYYAFYADTWNGEPIGLRGLEPGKEYTVCEYTSDDRKVYRIDGSAPVIRPHFKRNYLIEVYRIP